MTTYIDFEAFDSIVFIVIDQLFSPCFEKASKVHIECRPGQLFPIFVTIAVAVTVRLGRSQVHNPLRPHFDWGRLQTIPVSFGLPLRITIMPGKALLFYREPRDRSGIVRYNVRVAANGCVPSDIVTFVRPPLYIVATTLYRAISVVSKDQGVFSRSYLWQLGDRDGSKRATVLQPGILLIY